VSRRPVQASRPWRPPVKRGEELDRLKEDEFAAFRFHRDEDLGPLLREKPEFRHLLEK
jgi:hypothetical protein